MSALDAAPAHVERGSQNTFDLQCFGTYGCAYDIDDGIRCADFMEVNVLHVNVVNLGLRLSERAKNLARRLLGAVSNWRGGDDLQDLA